MGSGREVWGRRRNDPPGVQLWERPGLDLRSLSEDINVVFEREINV